VFTLVLENSVVSIQPAEYSIVIRE